MALVSVAGSDPGAAHGDHLRPGPPMSETISYEVVTAVGAVVRTFGESDHAREWLTDRRHELPGAQVLRVTTSVVRERVYKPRLMVAV